MLSGGIRHRSKVPSNVTQGLAATKRGERAKLIGAWQQIASAANPFGFLRKIKMDPSTDYIHCESLACCPKCKSMTYNCYQSGPLCYFCGKDVAKICEAHERFSFKITIAHSAIHSSLWKAVCHTCGSFQMVAPRFDMVCTKCLFKYDWVPPRILYVFRPILDIWEEWARTNNTPPLNTGLRT